VNCKNVSPGRGRRSDLLSQGRRRKDNVSGGAKKGERNLWENGLMRTFSLFGRRRAFANVSAVRKKKKSPVKQKEWTLGVKRTPAAIRKVLWGEQGKGGESMTAERGVVRQ